VATTQRRTVWLSGAMLGVLAIGWLSGSAAASKLGPAPTASTAGGSRSASVRTAARELAKLRVSGEAPKTRPPRGAFGPPWADVDRNGCDTRDDILRRDLIQVTLEPGSSCVVASGTLLDPYTGRQLAFVRRSPAQRVQIDHVVALGDAWRSGASRWTARRRLHFANDPVVLLAVDSAQLAAKAGRDASRWLPPNRSYDCGYAKEQIAIKARYTLSVTRAEKKALQATLRSCVAAP